MIASLTGQVLGAGVNWAIINVGGVGFKALCPPAVCAKLRIGGETQLITSLVVRQDSLTLFGFSTEAERDCFELVQQASGVGPKTALAVCAIMSPAEFVHAIQKGDVRALTQVPGIGRKGAEKIIIELRDRVLALEVTPEPQAAPVGEQNEALRQQVLEGLQSLGWSARDAAAAYEKVAILVTENPKISLPALMKAALQSMSRP